jgi:hypothetical protein
MEFSGRGRAAFLRKYASISGDLTSGLGGSDRGLGGIPDCGSDSLHLV